MSTGFVNARSDAMGLAVRGHPSLGSVSAVIAFHGICAWFLLGVSRISEDALPMGRSAALAPSLMGQTHYLTHRRFG